MNTANDRYVRVVLTVIAVSLVLLVVEGLPFPKAAAEPPKDVPPQRVEVVGTVQVKLPKDEAVDVVIVGTARKWWWLQEIPVKMAK